MCVTIKITLQMCSYSTAATTSTVSSNTESTITGATIPSEHTGSNASISTDLPACYVKENTSYGGHGTTMKKFDQVQDYESCRSKCRSSNVPYFVWRGRNPQGSGLGGKNKCLCKSELWGNTKYTQANAYSGNTMCRDGGFRYVFIVVSPRVGN